MDAFVKKIKKVLKANFPNADCELYASQESEKVGGFVVWAGFKSIEPIDRQSMVRKALERTLSAEELKHVSMISAMTPIEASVEEEV